MSSQPRAAIFIGRFQPLHNAHLETIVWALKNFDALVLVLGSAQTYPNPKNPWSETIRQTMISACLNQEQLARIHFVSVADDYYNDPRWFNSVRKAVNKITDLQNAEFHIVGYDKDSSSYYLHGFPEWGFVASGVVSPLSATDVRTDYFAGGTAWQQHVPAPVLEMLKEFKSNPEFVRLCEEAKQIAWYKNLDSKYPYPMVQVTVDALVIASNKILLVERAGNMGKGAWALPGGYLDKNETLLEAARRELMEETALNLGSLQAKAVHVFDYPSRSLRGHVVTHGHMFVLDGEPPAVKASDDAAKAFWFPVKELAANRAKFFDDHYQIVDWFLEIPSN